ncbi:MAG TPA: hypothetical protein VIR16_05615 [Candidatus Limnocylindrales bacterium]
MSPHLAQQRLLAQCPRRAIALASGHSGERLRNLLGVDPATFDRLVPKPIDPLTLLAWLDGLEQPHGRLDDEASRIRTVPTEGVRLPPTPEWRPTLQVLV